MTFKLEINLSGGAMQSYQDIAEALRQVANGLDLRAPDPKKNNTRPIRDANGKTVGQWELKP